MKTWTPLKAFIGNGEIYAVQSESNPERVYLVAFIVGGKTVCSCPATRLCKHIRAVREMSANGVQREGGSQ